MQRDYTPSFKKWQDRNSGDFGVNSCTFEQALSLLASDTSSGASWGASRSRPNRAAQIEADVLVPGAQTVVSAIAATLPAVIIAMWLRWQWYCPAVVASTTILISWFSSLNRMARERMNSEELWFSVEENSKGQIAASGVRMEVVEKQSDFEIRMKLLDLPAGISERDFGDFLKGLLAGKSTARKNWSGPGKTFSRDDYDEMCEKLVKANILAKRENNTKYLKPAGRAAISGMVRLGEM